MLELSNMNELENMEEEASNEHQVENIKESTSDGGYGWAIVAVSFMLQFIGG